MSALPPQLDHHLKSGLTTLCRCWAITRKDGVAFGFTDHDLALSFDGITFKADTGLTATALAQNTGLAADNSEALGALTDASVTEADIEAGRFDDAEVKTWLVNWANVSDRWEQFRGTIGEIRRSSGAFTAELRGLTEKLSQPVGRAYLRSCSAVHGDSCCGFNRQTPGFFAQLAVTASEGGRIFTWEALPEFEVGWFTRGRFDVLTGHAQGLSGQIKRDDTNGGYRIIELWEPLRAQISPGDQVRIYAGCDKRFETCRVKFNNAPNFKGFPDIPGEDWMVAVPKSSGSNSGGSLR